MPKKKVIIGCACMLAVVIAAGVVLLFVQHYRLDPAEAWTYPVPQHGVSLRIPSTDWKSVQKRGTEAAFYDAKHSALATVLIRRETKDAFMEGSVPKMKGMIEPQSDDFLSAPVFDQGTNGAGNPYAFWKVKTKATDGGTVFVAHSIVWCKDKQLTVAVTMEGQLRMTSQVASAAELDYLEKAAAILCLSPE